MCIHIWHIYFVIKFNTIKIVTMISLLKSTSNFAYYEIPYFNSKYVYSAVRGLPCRNTSWRRVKNMWNQRHRPWGSSEKLKQTHLLWMWGWHLYFPPSSQRVLSSERLCCPLLIGSHYLAWYCQSPGPASDSRFAQGEVSSAHVLIS